NKYINEQLKQVFPNGRFIEIPYGGQGMTKHLLNIGALKEYAITFIQKDKVPKYNQESYSKKRSQSLNYLRLLAKTCFEHNNIKCAYRITNQSLSFHTNNEHHNQLKQKYDNTNDEKEASTPTP